MTDLDREELRQDDLERRRQAEEAFEQCYTDWRIMHFSKTMYPHENRLKDWATIASEMGLTDFYKKLKEGK